MLFMKGYELGMADEGSASCLQVCKTLSKRPSLLA
jgi:hypothetical protein